MPSQSQLTPQQSTPSHGGSTDNRTSTRVPSNEELLLRLDRRLMAQARTRAVQEGVSYAQAVIEILGIDMEQLNAMLAEDAEPAPTPQLIELPTAGTESNATEGNTSEGNATGGNASSTEASATDLQASTERAVKDGLGIPRTATEVAEVTLQPGTWYTVTEADLAQGEEEAWTTIARNFGLHDSVLMAFNQHVETVQEDGKLARVAKVAALAAGVRLYIPSADEQAFAEARKKAGNYEGAVQLYGKLAKGSNIRILRAARMRATGRRGVGYGTKGVDGRNGNAGVFLSPNKALAGARESRSEIIDGQREYRINWNATADGFWKCSVFLEDTVFQAGYDAAETSNGHYQLAGRLHESRNFEEISVKEAGPGSLWQRFGGRGSDESHNAILTSYVTIEPAYGDYERWTFHILGAETDRAADSERTYTVKKGTNETTGGEIIRFFKPRGT